MGNDQEPTRCKCGACYWHPQLRVWFWQRTPDEYGYGVPITTLRKATAHCPGECGCRLTAVKCERCNGDGHFGDADMDYRCPDCGGTGRLPVVGESFADPQERAAEHRLPDELACCCPPGAYGDCCEGVVEQCRQDRRVAMECWYRWLLAMARRETDGQDWQCKEPIGAMIETEDIPGIMARPKQPEVGPSQAELLAAIAKLLPEDRIQPLEILIDTGLATSYRQAAALWERMKAAKGDADDG